MSSDTRGPNRFLRDIEQQGDENTGTDPNRDTGPGPGPDGPGPARLRLRLGPRLRPRPRPRARARARPTLTPLWRCSLLLGCLDGGQCFFTE